MTVTCPHCKKEIDLVGAKELKDDYGLSPNTVQHARDRGNFPESFMSFGNRNLWLRETIQGYMEERSRSRVESHVTELMRALEHMPADAREEARALLEERLKA